MNKEELTKHWNLVFAVEHDGRVFGVTKLMYTHAIITDLDCNFYHQRFCFHKKEDAILELKKWKLRGFDSLPNKWIACRGVSPSQLISGLGKDYAQDVIETMKEASISGLYQSKEDMDKLLGVLNINHDDLEHKLAFLKMSEQI